MKVYPAAPQPCSECPWRLSNQGKPHPDGWYSKSNLKRLWSKLRKGENMSCHPTDPTNPIPEGCTPVPTDARTLECAGALILQQRELMRFQGAMNGIDKRAQVFATYRKQNPNGMTLRGLGSIIERSIFGGVLGGVKMSRPDLRAEVGYQRLKPWTEEDENSIPRQI